MELSQHLEALARSYWKSWRVLRLNQGWTLGSDNGAAKMSPYLVHNFDGLDVEGKAHFRQQVALVLHAIDELETGATGPVPVAPVAAPLHRALPKIGAALRALDQETPDWGLARRKARTARRILRGEPVRPK